MSSVGGIPPVGAAGSVGGVNNLPSVSGAQTGTNAARQATPEEKADGKTSDVMQKKRLGIIECETCENRRYQDGSDDPGVSFKSPTKLSPQQAASAVPSHEREHYNRESAEAERNDREVVSNNIKIFTSVCPECGRTYVSGGLTTTVTKAKKKTDEEDAVMQLFGTGGNEKSKPDSVFNINLNIANKAYGLNYDEKQ